MDVIARRALECPGVEANRAGGNPRQLGTRLAHGAEWSQDVHNASPLVQAGALQNSQSPVDTEGDGDGGDRASMEPFAIPPLVNFAHFRKVNKQGGPAKTPPKINDAVVARVAAQLKSKMPSKIDLAVGTYPADLHNR